MAAGTLSPEARPVLALAEQVQERRQSVLSLA